MEKVISPLKLMTKLESKTIKRSSDLYGLILTGGQSSRMGEDKALLKYRGLTQLEHGYELLEKFCSKTFVSVSQKNSTEQARQKFPLIVDQFEHGGPLNGIASALSAEPNKAWLVIACDLPLLDESTLSFLIEHRQTHKDATAFLSNYVELPEPLCTIWEPQIIQRVLNAIDGNKSCPRKILIQADTELLSPINPHALDNANTPDEKSEIFKSL